MASRLELEETGAFADGEACCGAGCWEETVVTATDEGPQPMYLTLHYVHHFFGFPDERLPYTYK